AALVGLQAGGDDRLDAVPDLVGGVLHDHHGAVFQVGKALTGFPALPHDVQRQPLSGHEGGLHRVGKLVEVEDADALQSRDATEVVVGGYEVVAGLEAERDELVIDRRLGGRSATGDLGDDVGVGHQGIKDLQAAPSALPAQRVLGVCQSLQLSQDELRDDQVAVNEV